MKKLLIVDDQSFIRTVFKNKVKNLKDVIIMEAADGDDALKVAKQELPDLILLDIVMPKVDGITILNELKNNPDTESIPIVIISSQADDKRQSQAMELGAEAFYNKSDIMQVNLEEVVLKYIR